MGNLELTHVKNRSTAADTETGTSTTGSPLSHRYAFCDVAIQDATLLDYALLSLLSYFDRDSPDFKAPFGTIAAVDDWVVRDEDIWATAVEAASIGGEEESSAPAPTVMHTTGVAPCHRTFLQPGSIATAAKPYSPPPSLVLSKLTFEHTHTRNSSPLAAT
jgi:hypothetical protein